jgi:hypothetical protein
MPTSLLCRLQTAHSPYTDAQLPQGVMPPVLPDNLSRVCRAGHIKCHLEALLHTPPAKPYRSGVETLQKDVNHFLYSRMQPSPPLRTACHAVCATQSLSQPRKQGTASTVC